MGSRDVGEGGPREPEEHCFYKVIINVGTRKDMRGENDGCCVLLAKCGARNYLK